MKVIFEQSSQNGNAVNFTIEGLETWEDFTAAQHYLNVAWRMANKDAYMSKPEEAGKGKASKCKKGCACGKSKLPQSTDLFSANMSYEHSVKPAHLEAVTAFRSELVDIVKAQGMGSVKDIAALMMKKSLLVAGGWQDILREAFTSVHGWFRLVLDIANEVEILDADKYQGGYTWAQLKEMFSSVMDSVKGELWTEDK